MGSKTLHCTYQQDEWVVCRVFQKSAGGKKYPSSHSRAVNTYNLEIGPSALSSQMMQADAFQIPMGRSYMSHAEMQELSRAFRGGSSSMNLPIPSQMNYAAVGGGGGCFTISGLNLNLGGAASTQPILRPATPVPPALNQQDVTSSILANNVIQNDSGYGAAEINNANAMSSRFVAMDHCADLENYWPTY